MTNPSMRCVRTWGLLRIPSGLAGVEGGRLGPLTAAGRMGGGRRGGGGGLLLLVS